MPELNRPLESVKPNFLKFVNLIMEYRRNETGKKGLIFIPIEKIGTVELGKFTHDLNKDEILIDFNTKDMAYLATLGFTIEDKDIMSNYLSKTKAGGNPYLILSCVAIEKIKKYLYSLYIPGIDRLIMGNDGPYALRQGKKGKGKLCALNEKEYEVLGFLYAHANEHQPIAKIKNECELSEAEISSACTSIRGKLRQHLGYSVEEMRRMMPRYTRGFYILNLA